ncbi:MAG TPA: hypothetical protein VH142_00110 [Polyangiaceae bacterium]|nr:hypothetical protein [Polyangiaceae bacterium]
MTTRTLKLRGCAAAIFAALSAAAWSAMAAVTAAPADDIRDIRPLILIPPWWRWVPYALAAGLFAVAVGFGIREWQRRSQKSLTPEERAREELARAEALARQGRCHEWAEVVARTLRNALAARLGQESCPETTVELRAMNWDAANDGASVDAPRLLELLNTCDLTRFAMARLEADSLVASTESARDWVTHLFAVPEPSASSGAEQTR